MKKIIPIIAVSIVVFLVVGYFIFNYTVKKITEREVKRITKQEIGRITDEETERITQSEIDRITDDIVKQRTEEITRQIMGGGTDTSKLKEVQCDKTPSLRQFSSDSYYTGPLIDAHVHIPFTFEVPPSIYAEADWDAPILEKEVFAGQIICAFDKENTKSSIGFYAIPSPLKGLAVSPVKQVEQKHTGRIVAFMMPTHVSGLDLMPNEIEEVLNSNKGLFKGYGEIAMYKGVYKGMSPDDSSLLEIYKIADKHNLIVMMHPDYGQQQAVERILKEYPNVKFLFHGEEASRYAAEIVGKFPNAYFTIDGDLSDIPEDPQSVSLYGSGSKEKFISDYKRDYSRVMDRAINKWKAAIEKHPDKFLWGTDRAYAWHFDYEVGGLIEEFSRSFIGQLDASVQEKFAYRNAERLLREK